MSTSPFPVIIDTDPGVDDALAILFAHLALELDVRGITTVYGNQTIEKTTSNACVIAGLAGRKTPVFRGASRPLTKELKVAVSHGEDGLGGYKASGLLQPSASPGLLQPQDAMSFLATTVVPGMSIACLGPTTNIAMLANLYPDVLRQAKQIVIMGGAFNAVGNVSPWAEFNVFNDPDALANVLAIEGPAKVIIPADVCRAVTMDERDFLQAKDQSLSQAIRDIVSEYVKYYKDDQVCGGFEGGVMYDTLVTAYMLWPELFHVEPAHVVVERGDGPARGATAVDQSKKDRPNCLLVSRGHKNMPLGVDVVKVKQRLLALLS